MPVTFDSYDRINQVETERDIEELLHLFLKEYFDGTAKTVDPDDPDTVDLEFPACDFLYGVAQLPTYTEDEEPLPLIHTLINDLRFDRRCASQSDKDLIEKDLLFSFTVRAPHRGNTERGARTTARRIADRLALLVEHAPSLRLAQKGFRNIKVVRGPEEIPMVGYAVRTLVIEAKIQVEQTLNR